MLRTSTTEAADVVRRARELIPSLKERAPAAARARSLSAQTIADMREAGVFRVLQPKRWGGLELDLRTYFEVQLALAEGDISAGWIYGVVGVPPWLLALRYDDADLFVAGADGEGDARRGRLSFERALEILERVRALQLGVPRRDRSLRKSRSAGSTALFVAAQRLRDRRYLERPGLTGDWEP